MAEPLSVVSVSHTYDTYGRLSEVQYFDPNNNEYTAQRVTYYYDSNFPCTGPTTPSGQYELAA